MKTDIVKFCLFDRKPEKLDLYTNEYGMLYKCWDPIRNDKEGWPGKKIQTIISCLEKQIYLLKKWLNCLLLFGNTK